MGQAAQVEAQYNCTIPSKVNADLFVFCGTSLMNGYSTTTIGLDSQVVSFYFPDGDQIYAERFGTLAQGYSTPVNNRGQFLYLNNAYNYDAGSNRFGSDTIIAKELYSKYSWDRPIFIFHHEQNGASLIAGESSPDWSLNGTVYPVMIASLVRCVQILKSRGYNLRITLVWGSAAVTSITVTDYQTAINNLISGIRAAVEDSTIRILWGKPTIQGAAPAQAYRSGVDLVVANDSYVKSFDYDYLEVGGDGVHPTTMAMIDLGHILAGWFNELYNGNQRPTVSNVQITGTLKNGQAIGVSYDYSDTESNAENTNIVADTFRFREDTGTRVEFYSADDALGTNIDYMSASRNKGETFTLNITHVGKYIQAFVFPKAQSGSLHGYPVKSAWVGPVIA